MTVVNCGGTVKMVDPDTSVVVNVIGSDSVVIGEGLLLCVVVGLPALYVEVGGGDVVLVLLVGEPTVAEAELEPLLDADELESVDSEIMSLRDDWDVDVDIEAGDVEILVDDGEVEEEDVVVVSSDILLLDEDAEEEEEEESAEDDILEGVEDGELEGDEE